jgi:hypothetical protein
VYQDSLALSAQLRNLGSFTLQQDKVLGRGSLAVVQEGELVLIGCRVQGHSLDMQQNKVLGHSNLALKVVAVVNTRWQ